MSDYGFPQKRSKKKDKRKEKKKHPYKKGGRHRSIEIKPQK
jgi:hypothetical protein